MTTLSFPTFFPSCFDSKCDFLASSNLRLGQVLGQIVHSWLNLQNKFRKYATFWNMKIIQLFIKWGTMVQCSKSKQSFLKLSIFTDGQFQDNLNFYVPIWPTYSKNVHTIWKFNTFLGTMIFYIFSESKKLSFWQILSLWICILGNFSHQKLWKIP